MYELAIQEMENQLRIIHQKLPSIDESIKTYAQMTKNYEREKADLLAKQQQLLDGINLLKEADK